MVTSFAERLEDQLRAVNRQQTATGASGARCAGQFPARPSQVRWLDHGHRQASMISTRLGAPGAANSFDYNLSPCPRREGLFRPSPSNPDPSRRQLSQPSTEGRTDGSYPRFPGRPITWSFFAAPFAIAPRRAVSATTWPRRWPGRVVRSAAPVAQARLSRPAMCSTEYGMFTCT